jgi:hypothetical protein
MQKLLRKSFSAVLMNRSLAMTKKKERNPIINTTTQPPELHLLGALGDSMHRKHPGSFIEDMEARGQHQLVSQSSRLPTEGLTSGRGGELDPELRKLWEALGFKIGQPVEGDPIFTNVELSEGWTIKATDHSMSSDLLDAKGRKRASVFYKAAFYDRSAFIRLNNRFFIGVEYRKKTSEDRHRRHLVIDTATNVGGDDPTLYGYADYPNGGVRLVTKWTKDLDGNRTKCLAWLNKQYPRWEDPTAYWDIELSEDCKRPAFRKGDEQ